MRHDKSRPVRNGVDIRLQQPRVHLAGKPPGTGRRNSAYYGLAKTYLHHTPGNLGIPPKLALPDRFTQNQLWHVTVSFTTRRSKPYRQLD
jgi:hypothetical protein